MKSAIKNMELCFLMKRLMLKDSVTFIHSYRVSEIALSFVHELGFSESERKTIHVGGLLHDIGKLKIEEGILNKKERLTEQEFRTIQKHPVYGEAILKKYVFTDEILMAKHHHERWDGRGYPDGLQGEEIPTFARVLALADSLEAMTGIRPYRRSLNWDEAYEEIAQGQGTQFDPELTEQFLGWMKKTNVSVKEDVEQLYRQIVQAI
ncbi:HD-GYP domain-containing protein [Brevibacillus sp. SYSU BS000544]|uniref:HD-GYP domain-containing protein n=1 Tax=Brevibacillus sp. SYSU BS000544 TaxID=3416443 RepID=UPI003CE516AB